MNWTNFLTKKYADQHKSCPVAHADYSSSWTIKQVLMRLELELREHYLKVYKAAELDPFVRHLVEKAYDEIDWAQLAIYWADESTKAPKELQLELI